MKFCGYCGQKMEATNKFCPSCGKPSRGVEEAAAVEVVRQTPSSIPPTEPKKGFSKKWVIIVALAVIIVGGSSAFTMFLNKNPKELYLLSEFKSYTSMVDEYKEKYGEDLDFQKELLESPSSSEVKISGNLDIENEDSYEMEMFKEILDQTTLILQTNQDPKEQEGHYKLALEVEGSNLADVELVQTKTQAGLRIPFLYDQFFYLNFDEYGNFMRMIDPYYSGPETLELDGMNWDELKLSEKELKGIKERYSKFFLSVLEDENFSLEKGVKLEHEGETIKVREITFELSPKEVKGLFNKFFDHLIEDKELQKLMANRAIKIAEAASLEEEIDSEYLNQDYLVDELKSGLQEAKSALDEVQFPKGFKSVILIDKKEQIVSREIEFAIGDEYQIMEFDVGTKNIPYDKNKKFKELKIELAPEDQEDGKMILGYSNIIATGDNKRTEDMKANFYFDEYGETQFDIQLSLNSIFKGKDSSKQTIEREFDLNIAGDEFYDEPVINGRIIEEKDISVKDKYANQKFDIQTSIFDGYDSGTITLIVDSKTDLKNKLDIPKLDGNEGRNITELTEYDYYEIMEEVQYRLEDIVEQMGINYY